MSAHAPVPSMPARLVLGTAAATVGLLGFLAPGSFVFGASVGPWAVQPESKARLVSGWDEAPPTGEEVGLDLGIDFELAPGWHVYWKNSGDAGYAPKADFSATPGLGQTELLYPAPHRFELPGGLVSFGYENEVIYPVSGKLRMPATEVPGGSAVLTIRGRVDYLVCADECIPYTANLELDLAPRREGAGAAGAAAASRSTESAAVEARLARWRSAIPAPAFRVADAPLVKASLDRADYPFSTLELVASGGSFRANAPDLFFETHDYFALGKPELAIGGSGLKFRVPIRPLDETKPVPATADFAWTLTGLEGNAGPFAMEGKSTVSIPAPKPSRRFIWIAAFVVVTASFLAWSSRRAPRTP